MFINYMSGILFKILLIADFAVNAIAVLFIYKLKQSSRNKHSITAVMHRMLQLPN